MNEAESDKTGKLGFESVFGFVRTTLASLAALSATKTMRRPFVFAMALKLSILLHKHLDADARKSESYYYKGDEKDCPKHRNKLFGKNSFFLLSIWNMAFILYICTVLTQLKQLKLLSNTNNNYLITN